ncbi:MAG: hypothetical protein K2R98_16360 [Gemmataceae bacterium]|nr:hypothetical protein [Gemmataceae bacterium]
MSATTQSVLEWILVFSSYFPGLTCPEFDSRLFAWHGATIRVTDDHMAAQFFDSHRDRGLSRVIDVFADGTPLVRFCPTEERWPWIKEMLHEPKTARELKVVHVRLYEQPETSVTALIQSVGKVAASLDPASRCVIYIHLWSNKPLLKGFPPPPAPAVFAGGGVR